VTVVLNSKHLASCSCCGATWIQEGSWQRAVRPGQARLPAEVIALPDAVTHAPRLAPETPAEEAIAT
jgi:hypothetical protein